MTINTIPEVFIIESLRPQDVENGRREGDLIARILKMGGRNPICEYVASRDEFRQAISAFTEANYRYLHISSHGGSDHFEFQFGDMYLGEFLNITQNRLAERRVFVSACEVVNHNTHELANVVLRDTGCYSLIGTAEEIDFDDAAMFWSTFYYLAYKEMAEKTALKRDLIIDILKNLTGIYPVKINYYSIKNDTIKLDRFIEGRRKPL